MTEYPGDSNRQDEPPHAPVLLPEVLDALAPATGKRIVDGTFGAGGYAQALLEDGAEVVALDRDPSVLPHAERLSGDHPGRFTFIPGRFSQLDALVRDAGVTHVDAVVLDIGVSSMQLDQPERGFSFMREGPLDMRMSDEGATAADLVNGLDEKVLADLLFAFGEERKSRRIARAVVMARAEKPIRTTSRLVDIIEKAIGRKPGAMHPATRSFQALRIAVNAELDELVQALFAAESLLAEGGVLVVVTFHSLEDRIVKRFLAEADPDATRSRHLPRSEAAAARWAPVAKPRKPSVGELQRNPRARSSVLRAAVRTAHPARPASVANLGMPGFDLARLAAGGAS